MISYWDILPEEDWEMERSYLIAVACECGCFVELKEGYEERTCPKCKTTYKIGLQVLRLAKERIGKG